MPLEQFDDLKFPEWLQGASWEVQPDITDGSGEFGLRKNTSLSGRRRVLADVTLRLLGQQLMAFEAFCVNDLNNCKDKFLANYIDGSGLKNGVVKFVDGYSVSTDGRNHAVSFTLELPSYPNRAELVQSCTSNLIGGVLWTSNELDFFTTPNRWESNSTAAEKRLNGVGFSFNFRPNRAAITSTALSGTPYTVDVKYIAENPNLNATAVIGGARMNMSSSDPQTFATNLKWPTGTSDNVWRLLRIEFILSTGNDDLYINCLELI